MALITVEQRMKDCVYDAVLLMPYQALVKRLEQRIEKEKNKERREELQLQLVLLLAIMEVRSTIDHIIENINKVE